MKISRIIGLLAVVAFIVPVVSAAGIGNENDGVAGLLSQPDEYGICEYFTITQGETDTHLFNVPAGMSLLKVDLNWFTPDHSLRLEIYRSDGSLYGSYHDNSDGRLDGRTRVDISIPASGNWRIKVYGESVTGTIPYALNCNAYT
ncbi:pre-peptidase C-terminal domain-containing protein [Methanoculleus sp.]|uniref:pre-peptidase C-terminal domain-containing protein n=1 Tax=Methanoculleus sp. TaxID=90427 RepID=UPI00261E5153|nr:pre-peptidase C-terminal domain-containing protein [Methanoculleus sp.]MDI6866925.1 pre-peptidase C-terminal domain-containing protein [Methanoculleus sp.]